MMAMMEKYANNLEVLVDERTDQLQEEKKKTGKMTNCVSKVSQGGKYRDLYRTYHMEAPSVCGG